MLRKTIIAVALTLPFAAQAQIPPLGYTPSIVRPMPAGQMPTYAPVYTPPTNFTVISPDSYSFGSYGNGSGYMQTIPNNNFGTSSYTHFNYR